MVQYLNAMEDTSNYNNYNEINFSDILKEKFHATLNNNNDVTIKRGTFNKNETSTQISLEETLMGSSTFSFLAKQYFTEICLIPHKLYCPFCAKYFYLEFTLKDHLQKKHIHEIIERQNKEQEMFYCCVCDSKFHYKVVLLEHFVSRHKEVVLNYTQNGFKCRFCNYMSSNKTLLSNHILNIHASELENMIENINKINRTVILNCTNKNPKQYRLPQFKFQPKSILKRHKSPINGKDTIHRSKGLFVKKELQTRRELTFDIPHAEKEETIGLLPNSKHVFIKSLKINERDFNNSLDFITSTPLSKQVTKNQQIIPLKKLHYQCGYCKQKFEENVYLLIHIHEKHKNNINFFRKPYRCGECVAKFYKNRYLVMHSNFHSKPTYQSVN